jgi:outer membrane protein
MRKLSMAMVIVMGLASGGPAAAQAPTQPAPTQPTAPATASPQPAAAATNQRIGFVDVQRVLARSVAGVAAREQLEREKATMQKEMDTKRVELDKLRDEIEKKGPLMTADVRREKQDTFERKRRDATRLADDFQKELQKKEQDLLNRVLADLSVVIERLGKQRGYYLVVEKRGATVLYASAEADLTDEVIRAYDQEAGAKGKK